MGVGGGDGDGSVGWSGDEILGAEDDREREALGVLAPRLGRVHDDPEVVASDDEDVAVERDPTDLTVVDDFVTRLLLGVAETGRIPELEESGARDTEVSDERGDPRSLGYRLAVSRRSATSPASNAAFSLGVWTTRVPGPMRLRHTALRSTPRQLKVGPIRASYGAWRSGGSTPRRRRRRVCAPAGRADVAPSGSRESRSRLPREREPRQSEQ